MATCYVTFWLGIREAEGGIQAPYGKLGKDTLTVSTEDHTAVFPAACKLIEFSTDTAMHFVAEKDAVATTSDMWVPASTHSKFQCVNGGVDRLSVIVAA